MKILVLAGGLSDERDVSLTSGSLIANALLENGHTVMLSDLYLGGKNPDFAPVWHSAADGYRYSYSVPVKEPDLDRLKRLKGDNTLIAEELINFAREADKVFLALHGAIGENGQLQALFDIYGIKYTGSSSFGSRLAMNKNVAKKVMRYSGIPTPSWVCLDKDSDIDLDKIKLPRVVKPCSNGSSIGINIADTTQELKDAVSYARRYEEEVLIEEKITGREFTVGVLDGRALPVIEIKPLKGFYNYENKYQRGLTIEECPADITDEEREKLRSLALAVHKALKLGLYARIDFLMDTNGRFYCLEANTLPGMTPTSLLPQAAAARGVNYNDLCEILIGNKKF